MLRPAQWEEMQPEVLVNARSKMGGLNELLARLENLSHILVWRDETRVIAACFALVPFFSLAIFPT